jgi:glycosyltransferase involved in cell wall biosynthesis
MGGMSTILQILPALVTGGVERGTIEMTAALAAAGHTPMVASSGGPMAKEVTEAGGAHFCLPLATKNPVGMYNNIGRIADIIRHYRVDLVHARSRAPAWSAWFATLQTGIPFVTTFHNAYGAATWQKRFYNSVMARGQRVIAISDFVADHVASTYHVPRDRLRTIHRGVDIAQFDPEKVAPARLEALRTAWRLDTARPVIMLPGRISGWKGHDILIAALAQLDRKDVQTIFVGGGDPEKELAIDNLIKQHGLGDRVKRVGTCRDMPAALLLADLVISPATRPEGFGRIIAEAQAMGSLVIATDHGGARETIIADETGWLVAPGNVTGLAQAITGALGLDPERRADMGRKAIAHIRKNFTTTAMTAATLKVYDEILRQK